MTPTDGFSNRSGVHTEHAAEGFPDSFGLFAAIVMGTFAIATLLAIVGLAQPSWLGFS